MYTDFTQQMGVLIVVTLLLSLLLKFIENDFWVQAISTNTSVDTLDPLGILNTSTITSESNKLDLYL